MRSLLTLTGPLLPCVLITRQCLGDLEKLILQNEISFVLKVSLRSFSIIDFFEQISTYPLLPFNIKDVKTYPKLKVES